MTGPLIDAFAAIAFALFVAELTDKDALLLLTLATRERAATVFLAGATAFIATTTLFVSVGTLLIAAIPILWVRLFGGSVMLGYALWQLRGMAGGKKTSEKESRENHRPRLGGLRGFFAVVGALALLDMAGDATEVLTIVLVAQYSDAILVFLAACTGLISATALETALGSRLGKVLTPHRLRYFSTVILLVLGTWIITSGLI